MPPKLKVLESQIKTAASIWQEVASSPTPTDRWLGQFFHKNRKRYGSRDRRFISEIVYSLFRHKTFLEAWMSALGNSPHPEAIVLAAAILENQITREHFEQVYESFFNAKPPTQFYEKMSTRSLPSTGASGVGELALKYSCPDWLIERWEREFGAKRVEKILMAQNERPPLMIRVNLIKTDRDRLMKNFAAEKHDVRETFLSSCGILFKERANLFTMKEFQEGHFEVQDEGSQFVCEMMEPKPGEVIWDVCAGGGGKSLALGALMANKGRVVATDIRPKKLEDLKKRAKRAGIFNIFPADMNRLTESKIMKKGIDKILIDAPCSGSGTFRRNPDAKWKIREEDFKRYHANQIAIIESALPYLKKEGLLYYVTCSIDIEENEDVVVQLLAKHPELEKRPISEVPIAAKHALSIQTQEGSMRLWPHEHGTDGFFLAILKKKSD